MRLFSVLVVLGCAQVLAASSQQQAGHVGHNSSTLKLQSLPVSAAVLQVSGPRGWLPQDTSQLKLSFSPPLDQGVDFSIWAEPNLHVIPDQFQIRKNAPSFLHVLLLPGKRWIKDMRENRTQELRLVSVKHGKKELTGYRKSAMEDKHDVVARVTNYPGTTRPCPTLNLPGASEALQRKVNEILHHCQRPLFISSRDLKWKQFHSLSLLQLQPPMLFVDGADEEIPLAAKNVDRFLAAHSVLDVVWEPMNANDPHYWILMPRPFGMPGHLFAVLDVMQWRHHLVSSDYSFKNKGQPFCSSQKICDLGCKYTKLAGITGSGYSADAFNTYNVLHEGFMRNLPVQAFPTTLGKRTIPPFWEGVTGWQYSFKACKTNFMDCYFLDHSPCPKIAHNIRDGRDMVSFSVNRSRLTMPPFPNMEMRPKWWSPLVGTPREGIPERSIRDLSQGSVPARMVFYSYMFRPNYMVRQNVERKAKAFDLKKGDKNSVFATMHVRRGDVLLHMGQARFYIPLHVYVQGALPFIKTLGVNSILLLTDSQTVIDEAVACEQKHPAICGGLSWRYVNKTRWYAAEGGWENPFPSGSAIEEFENIQLEFALAQQTDLMIMGNSGYGDLVYNHMCCKFPLHMRGEIPQRCICPPKVRLEQSGFTCEAGNKIMCGKQNRGGRVEKRLDDPANMRGANFSRTEDAYKTDIKVWLTTNDQEKSFMLKEANDKNVQKFIANVCHEAKEEVCETKYRDGPKRNVKIC